MIGGGGQLSLDLDNYRRYGRFMTGSSARGRVQVDLVLKNNDQMHVTSVFRSFLSLLRARDLPTHL